MAEDESEEHEWHIRLKQDEEMDFFTELALHEAERWIQAVTRKKFQHPDDFRGSLSNGVLLCELLNNLKAGSIKKINKLPGAIAGLDNLNVFLRTCEKIFGLTRTQLFDPGDLEDLSQRAIADESEYLLKQEVDRRARNVAITIYWLGRQVEGTFKGPSLDFSAFSALVHHQGNKNIISNDSFKNENWKNNQTVRQNSKEVKRNSHARDSSYDSLGSYEKESESSFDDLDNSENMPVRDLRRYGSQSSLGKNENTSYSIANDSAFSDRHDSVYQSSPELSQGSHAHTRSSSTDDSMDGSYYGNSHSRQSSGSTEGYATRLPTAGGGRRTSSSGAPTGASVDPLQFVKTKGADELAKTAAKQIEAAKETALMRPALRGDEGEPDWQSKLSGWKSRRKSASAAVYQRVGEVEGLFTEDEPEKPRTKTFSQITAEKEKRKSLGNLRSFYPMEDDESFSAKLKEHDTLHIIKSEDEITQSTEIKLKKKAKGEEVAPWARDSSGEGDSQSDSEINISHQSGDTDNVFAEQTVSKVVNRDESWVKKSSFSGSQTSPSVRQTPPPVGNKSIKDRNMQLWENSAKESQKKMDKTKVDIPANRSINKIKNITKAFEEKESSAKAEPVIQRRSDYGRKSWSMDSTDSPFRRRSSDFSDKSDKSSPKGFNEKNVSPLLSPTSPKALLPKDQRPSPSNNFKYTSDYSSNKPLEGSSRSEYLQKLSTPPAAPFGYRARLTSSDKDLPATGNREQSYPSPLNIGKTGPNFGTSSVSKSPEVKSPVSDVFYGTQRKYAASAPALFRAAMDKDVKGMAMPQDKPKVEASTSSIDDGGLSVDASEAASGVDCGNTESEIDNGKIDFYLPAENGQEMPDDTAEEPGEKHDNVTDSLVEFEKATEIDKVNDENNDVGDERVANELFETKSIEKDTENDLVAADNVSGGNLNNVSASGKAENVDNTDNLIAESDSGNTAQMSEENGKNNVINENMYQTTTYQRYNKPNFFVFPSPVTMNREELKQCPAKEDNSGNFSPEVHSLDSDEENNIGEANNIGMSDYHVSHSIADDMANLDTGCTPEFDYDSIVNLEFMINNEKVSDIVNLHSSGIECEQIGEKTCDLVDPDTERTLDDVHKGEQSSQPPDLISSLPYLPLLTPYSSEGSGTDRVSTASTAEQLSAATENKAESLNPAESLNQTDDDVFYDDGKKAENGLQTFNVAGQDGIFERNLEEKKFIEKTIKISQAPNNSRGFGFFVSGGSDKREPVTVSKVSLGSSADISDVLMSDEVLSVNNHEVENMTLKQVQGIIDQSVKRGQIELKIRRKPDEGSFDSLDEEGVGGYLGGNNKMDTQSDSSSFSTDPLSDDASYKTPQSSTRQTGSDDNEKPSLMDRLLAEKSREPNNNLDMSMYKSEPKQEKPPSPVAVENLKAEISFSSHMTPSRRSPVTQQKTEVPVPAVADPTQEQPVYASSRESPNSQARNEISESVKSEWPSAQTLQTERDMVAPVGDTVVEERQTITMKPSPVVQDDPPVAAVRRRRTPDKQREEPKRETPPPAPPVAEAPPLPKLSDDESGGFGPPAALLRWQRPRAKSEHKVNTPYMSVFDRQVEDAKRLSSTLPWRSEDSDNKDTKEVSKDDSVLSRVSKDFESTVSVSKPPLTKSRTYHFDDVSKIQDWDQRQEEKRQPEPGRPVSPPPAFEVEIHKEEKLTAQLESQPGRKAGVPAIIDIPVTIPGKDDTPLSPQEKFERDQQRIRQQYEEEKRRAKEAEKQREQQEQQLIKKDSERLLNLESQIQPNKLDDIKPVHPPVQSKLPQFTSEPITMKVPANSQGRHLVIDPRNRDEENRDAPLPQYQFHVDLQKQEDKPKLRTLNQEPELSPDQLLERERERIREEEHRKFEEEKRRWKEEQDEQLRREQERLKAEREAIEREKAKLEQRNEPPSRYQPVTIHTSPRSSWAGSPSSHSPKSPPPALDPHHKGSSGPSRKADIWAPPSTQHKASKSDIGTKERARLTREDLLAMNRKATPLQTMNKKYDEQASENKEPEHVSREAPSKLELHMLNSVPKPKFRRAADWIKDEEEESSAPINRYADPADKYADKQFVIGNRSDIIHKDCSTSKDHWVVQEAERRRLAENKDYSRRQFADSVHTAGPAKPSGSSLVNRFRGDIEPNKKNRYSYPTPHDTDSHPPARPLSTSGSGLRHFERSASPELSSTQFSARNQSLNFANPSLSNTLPANFQFNANKAPKREPPAPAPKPKRSPTEPSDQTHTVSGKQRCSHCEEELGFGAAMVIESLGLYYHVQCFRCCVCRAPLGSGSEGADVRVRVNKLHCRNCFSNDEAGLKFSKV